MTPAYPIAIRPAKREDAPAMAAFSQKVFIDTFVTGFGIVYPPEDLNPYLDQIHGPAAMERRITDPARGAWVAEYRGEVIGYATAGPMGLPHPDAGPSDRELCGLYVDSAHHGQGVAPSLMETAWAWMEADARTTWIGVWSGNIRAQRFYARYGYEKAGEYDYPVGRTLDREFILRRLPMSRG